MGLLFSKLWSLFTNEGENNVLTKQWGLSHDQLPLKHNIFLGWGYTHDRHADKNPYRHDGRADKDSYPHDRNMTNDLCSK